ncbi:MAG: MFS transporter [Planctomycetota bacterium]|nr:MFS transporter [Planctomycetota bacterium]
MMFLQYAVQGVWMPLLPNYLLPSPEKGGLGFTGAQVGWILALAGAIGAFLAPFIAGQLADRYLNGERALGLLLLVSGIGYFITAYQTTFVPFLIFAIVCSIAYQPTLSITNSVAFANLQDPERRFPPLRMLGTVGFIGATILFPMVWLRGVDEVEKTARIGDSLKVAGVMSIAYAAFCVVLLPKTPPKKNGGNPLAFVEAFALLRHPGFAVIMLLALPIAVIHSAFFMRMAPFLKDAIGVKQEYVTSAMAIGQASEIFCLLALGFLLKRLGYKVVLAIGIAAYLVRFVIFAVGWPGPLVIAAIALHGVGFACFLAAAYVYVERVAPPDARHSVQTVFGIVVLGLGPVLSGFYNQYWDRFSHLADGVKVQDYSQFWWTQAAIAALTLLLLAALFPKTQTTTTQF